jgi:hypothetical protein
MSPLNGNKDSMIFAHDEINNQFGNDPSLSPEAIQRTLESVSYWDPEFFREIYEGFPPNKPSVWVAMYILFGYIPGMTKVCASHLASIYADIRPVFNCEKFRQRYGHLEGVDHLLDVMDGYMT